jgi:RNA polymerase sigma-70 factor (ECF subfamily)
VPESAAAPIELRRNLPDNVECEELGCLVAAARGGDTSAWERLYRRIHPRLRDYVAHRVSRSQIDDVVDETMARAVAGLARFSWPPDRFDAWVFGIARNICADHHRQAARAQRLTPAEDRSATGLEPSEYVELGEEHARVREAFTRLSEAERDLLTLRVIAGLSTEEVAVAVGKRPGAVRTAQSRALTRLRVLLEQSE